MLNHQKKKKKSKKDKPKSKSKKIDKSSTLKPTKARTSKKYDQNGHLKTKTLVSNPSIRSKTNIKYDKMNDSEGYKYIKLAKENEKEKRYKSAINNYDKGIDLLENDLVSIDNAIEKRKRKEIIDNYRNTLMKLRQKVAEKEAKKKKVEKSEPVRVNVKNIEEYDGYKQIQNAQEYESKNQFEKAINVCTYISY